MTYITFAERYGIEQGIEKGLEQGIEKGREQGERDATLRILRSALKAKFGEEGEALLGLLPEQTPIVRLEELMLQVAVNTTLDVLRPQFSKP